MVSVDKVNFRSRGLRVAGNLYKPDGSGKHSAVVVSHP